MMVIPNRMRVVAVISALALAVGLLTLALLAKPALAQTSGASSEQFPVEFTTDATECAGELIDISGTLHVVSHFTVQPDGTYHVNTHFNFAGVKGVGRTTGDTYVVPATGAAVENFVEAGQIVTGTVDVNLIIGQGNLPDQVALIQLHYIIGPDGQIKVENSTFHFECRQ